MSGGRAIPKVDHTKSYDVLVVGAGLAGLRAALAVDPALSCVVLSKVYPVRSHSVAAQDGINAALGPEDRWQDHASDTIRGSDYLADQDAAELLCEDAARAVHEMVHWGTLFSRWPDGRLAQRSFGGQSYPRACYAGGGTGRALYQTLFERVVAERITVFEEFFAVSLVVADERVAGVLAIEVASGRLIAIPARAVIFATGGAGMMYARTTNPFIATGDGLAIAYRAGLPLKDMEFIQFHPMTLPGENLLITDRACGEGGHLQNADHDRFMGRYAPKLMEMAPQDVVARAIETEIFEGRGVGDGWVHLDLHHLGQDVIRHRLPALYDFITAHGGINPLQDPIPVQPGQHYLMGGIATGLEGQTRLPGFYAAGECAAVSVHGANRLGANSLLEALVFGRQAGRAATRFCRRASKAPPIPEASWQEWLDRLADLRGRRTHEYCWPIRARLRATMTDNVGTFRDGKRLRSARQVLAELKQAYQHAGVMDRGDVFNYELLAFLETGFLLDVAATVVQSALLREESRGAHWRSDFPARDDEHFLKHFLCSWSAKGPSVDEAPVTITQWAPKPRTY